MKCKTDLKILEAADQLRKSRVWLKNVKVGDTLVAVYQRNAVCTEEGGRYLVKVTSIEKGVITACSLLYPKEGDKYKFRASTGNRIDKEFYNPTRLIETTPEMVEDFLLKWEQEKVAREISALLSHSAYPDSTPLTLQDLKDIRDLIESRVKKELNTDD